MSILNYIVLSFISESNIKLDYNFIQSQIARVNNLLKKQH